MMSYLWKAQVQLTELRKHFIEKTHQLKEASLEAAKKLNRPIVHLSSAKTSKEGMAREIAEKDGIDEGLICVLTTVQQCQSYDVFRNREKKKIELVPRIRKCLFLYHYWIDSTFGLLRWRASWTRLSGVKHVDTLNSSRLSHSGREGGNAMLRPLRVKQAGWAVFSLCVLGATEGNALMPARLAAIRMDTDHPGR